MRKISRRAATLLLGGLLLACGDESSDGRKQESSGSPSTSVDGGSNVPLNGANGGSSGKLDGGATQSEASAAAASTGEAQCKGDSCVQRVALGADTGCLINKAKQLYCWGDNSLRDLPIEGDWSTGPAQAFESPNVPMTGVEDVRLAVGFSCAIRTGGTVWCWGLGDHGELGNGVVDKFGDEPKPPAQLPGLTDVTQISLGRTHVCALTRAGNVWCWGSNGHQELAGGAALVGDCAKDQPCSARPVQVVGVGGSGLLGDVSQIVAGHFTSCALLKNGQVACWGSAYSLPEQTQSTCAKKICAAPVILSELPKAVDMEFVAGDSTAIVTDDGKVRCWGSTTGCGAVDESGQNENTDVPMDTLKLNGQPLTGVKRLFSSTSQACAVTEGGELYCWGNGVHGELGNYDPDHVDGYGSADRATIVHRAPHVAMSGVADGAASDDNSCLISTAGDLYCWGKNRGSGLPNDRRTTLPGGDYAYPELMPLP